MRAVGLGPVVGLGGVGEVAGAVCGREAAGLGWEWDRGGRRADHGAEQGDGAVGVAVGGEFGGDQPAGAGCGAVVAVFGGAGGAQGVQGLGGAGRGLLAVGEEGQGVGEDGVVTMALGGVDGVEQEGPAEIGPTGG
ncbi:hypothetical protein ACTG9Q_19940 [Actinokineospora sp. 24-640]